MISPYPAFAPSITVAARQEGRKVTVRTVLSFIFTFVCSLAGTIWFWAVHGSPNDHFAGHDAKLE